MASGEGGSAAREWPVVPVAFVVTLLVSSALLGRGVGLAVAGFVTFGVAFAVHGLLGGAWTPLGGSEDPGVARGGHHES